MIYALVLNGTELRRQSFDADPPTLAPTKGQWLPVGSVPVPAYDPATQVRERKTIIADGMVTDGWDVRAKTAAEVRAGKLALIAALEATVTPRRMREAVLTPDGITWLANVESQIAALRAQL